MKLTRVATVLFVLLLSLSLSAIYTSMASQTLQSNQSSAVQYLKSHFSQTIGLIYESEDPGSITVGDYNYSHSQIYFVYSDNLLAEWALKPYDPQLSNTIKQTISSYNIADSGFYEVLFGTIIPDQMRAGVQLSIEQSPSYVVLAEFHNSSTALSPELNGDTLIYQSLNSYLSNDKASADYYFYKAYDMWDGKGIYDDTVKSFNSSEGDVPHYDNYKLALVLYASKVLNITIDDYSNVEDKLWSMQQENGGITCWADLDGNPIGSANAETTSIALLPYDDDLIQIMQSIKPTSTPTPTSSPTPTPTPTPSVPEFPIIILAIISLVGLSIGLLIREKKVT